MSNPVGQACAEGAREQQEDGLAVRRQQGSALLPPPARTDLGEGNISPVETGAEVHCLVSKMPSIGGALGGHQSVIHSV